MLSVKKSLVKRSLIVSLLTSSILFVSLLFPQIIKAEKPNGIVAYPAFFEITSTDNLQSFSYTIENLSETSFKFSPQILSFSQNEDLSYSFSKVTDSNISSQIKFKQDQITVLPKKKVLVSFEYLGNKVDSSQFLAIANKRVEESDSDVSLGESLVIPLFVNSKGSNVQGTETFIPNYFLEVVSLKILNALTLTPSNKVDIDIKNSGVDSVKPTFLLEVFNEKGGRMYQKKLNENEIRLLPESRFVTSVDYQINNTFKLTVIPEKYVVRVTGYDTDGRVILLKEEFYYLVPLLQIGSLTLVLFLIFRFGGKYSKPNIDLKKIIQRKKKSKVVTKT